MFIRWTVYASLPATIPTPLIHMYLICNGSGKHGIVWPTVSYHREILSPEQRVI
jgi:hypothetical protein